MASWLPISSAARAPAASSVGGGTPRPRRSRPATQAAHCLVALLLASACGPSTPEEPAEAPAAVADLGPHQVVVFATASLRRPFEAIARSYEGAHRGSRVELRSEGGAQLLAALHAGATADVVAMADSSVMARVSSAGFLSIAGPAELARSRIAIAVAPGNPKQIASLTDLARQDLRVALGARSASIGRHSRWALSRKQIEVTPVAEEDTAGDVLAKVADGTADAGIVYITTFADAPDRAHRIDVPEEQNTHVLYSISTTRQSREPRGAEAFVALALGPVGQELLREAGFLPIGAKIQLPGGRLNVP